MQAACSAGADTIVYDRGLLLLVSLAREKNTVTTMGTGRGIGVGSVFGRGRKSCRPPANGQMLSSRNMHTDPSQLHGDGGVFSFYGYF